jgi:hypothetical protein
MKINHQKKSRPTKRTNKDPKPSAIHINPLIIPDTNNRELFDPENWYPDF